MATIHRGASIVPSKLELVGGWLPSQRWYAAKGQVPRLRRLGGYRFEDPAGQVGSEVLILADDSGISPVVYQVALTYRGEPLAGAGHALVGTVEHSVLGTRWVYDAVHDPVFVSELVRTVLESDLSDQAGASVGLDEPAQGHGSGRATGRVARSDVLRGEQSNTSVICELVDSEGHPEAPLIIKIFRTLQDGENPDVVVQSALTDAGSSDCPTVFGSLTGAWESEDDSASAAKGHLAFAQEFIPGVQDAWRVALVAAAEQRDFSARAYDLGVMTARIHESLADHLPTAGPSPEARADLLTSMRSRFAAAAAAAPELQDREADVMTVLAVAETANWPRLQRIHGDYHLGQVLDVPDRGWVALDFEGEPLRPLAERSRPELPPRDIAGMLRSFDYAAGSVAVADEPVDASAWATACRKAFLDGYASLAGPRDEGWTALTRALELDKALYEVTYEARNRPTWLPIPLAGVHRLLDEAIAR